MADSLEHTSAISVHSLHAVLIAGAKPLFLGALLSDIAYASSPQPQWANFASWLIVGGMVFTGLALLWSVIRLLAPAGRNGRPLLVFGLLAFTFVIGFVDALWHTRDAWAMMPGGLVLSILLAVTACAATWAAFSTTRREIAP